MDAQFKQRIVGSIVLIVVVCLFLPVFFHHSATEPEKQQTEKLHTVTLDIPDQSTLKDQGQVLPQQSSSVAVTPVKQVTAAVKVVKLVRAETSTKPLSTVSHVKSNKSPPKKLAAVSSKLNVLKKITVKNSRHSERKPRHHANSHAIKHDKSAIDSAALMGVTTRAWVIQLASFSSSGNAIKLVTRLRKKGFDAYYRQKKYASGKSISRVFVGPEVKQVKLKGLQARLKRDFHLKGFILRYKP